jgi:hypothetical protein
VLIVIPNIYLIRGKKMNKGKLIFDGLSAPVQKEKVKDEKRSIIFHSIFWFLFGVIWIIGLSLMIKPSADIFAIFFLVLFFPLVFFIIGIILVIDSYRLEYIKIYEKGIVPQTREHFDVLLSRRKEIFLPFHDINIIYENPKRKYMSIVMKNFEKTIFGKRNEVFSINKDYLSLSDYEEIKSFLKKKVSFNNKINYRPIYG